MEQMLSSCHETRDRLHSTMPKERQTLPRQKRRSASNTLHIRNNISFDYMDDLVRSSLEMSTVKGLCYEMKKNQKENEDEGRGKDRNNRLSKFFFSNDWKE